MNGRRFAVLTVCTANICRSPMMEIMLREALDAESFEVASAGTRGYADRPMDAMAEMELMRFGMSAETFRSHPIDAHLLVSADLVLTASADHRRRVLEEEPRAMRRTFTLLEFAALCDQVAEDLSSIELVAAAAARRHTIRGSHDVGDPYRQSPKVHRETADQIHAAVATIAERLTRASKVTPV